MTWQERVGDLIFETANGDVFNCEFRDISSKRTDRTDITSFSNNIDYVQKLYFGSRVFDLEITFSGVDCDINAKYFEEATKDTRPIEMTHPLETKKIKGQITSLEKIDALATSANEVKFNIVFHESTSVETLVKAESLGKYIDISVNKLMLIDASKFADNISEIENPSMLDEIKNLLSNSIEFVSQAAKVYNYTTDQLAKLQQLTIQANNLLETVETNAESFASVYQAITNFPANALDMLTALAFYKSLYDSMLALFESSATASNSSVFALQGSCFIASMSLASSNADESVYVTKTACFNQAEKILELKGKYIDFIESAENAGFITVSQEGLNELENITTATAGALTQTAFNAKQTRYVTLLKNIDVYSFAYQKLIAETTDDLEKNVEDIININNLGGSELFILNQGRRLKYYV